MPFGQILTFSPLNQASLSRLLSKHAFWIALITSVLVGVVVATQGWTFYKTNDDIGLMYRVMGEWFISKPTPFTLFLHYDWSRFLILLYTWMPEIPWYPILLMTGVGVLNTAVLYYLLKRFKTNGALIYLLYFLSGGYLLFVELQFTISAACWAAVGLTLIVRGIKDQKPVYLIPLGMLFFWIGFMIRFKAGLLMLAFALPLLTYLAFRQWSMGRKRKSAFGAIIFAVLLLVSVGLNLRNQSGYSENDSWAQFLEQNASRSELHDFKAWESISPEKQEKILKEIGWSRNDMALFNEWYFWDSERFNLKNYRIIIDQSDRLRSTVSSIPQRWTNSLFRPYFYAVLIALVLIYLTSKRKKREKRLLLFSAVGILALLLIFVVLMKPAPERVSYGLMAAMLLGFAAFSRPKKEYTLGVLAASIILVGGVVAFINGADVHRKIKYSQKRKLEVIEIQETLDSFPNAKLLIWGGSYPWKGIDPFSADAVKDSSPALLFGALQQTPAIRQQALVMEIDDPFKSLVSDENVFLLLRRPDLKENQRLIEVYCQEHFATRLEWTLTKEVGDFVLVQAKQTRKVVTAESEIAITSKERQFRP